MPELCIYESGEPPASGRYVIRAEAGNICFELEWVDSSGVDHKLEYGGPIDGQRLEDDAPGVSHVLYEKIDGQTLDSTAYNEDEVIMYARRVASDSGDLLAVSQVVYSDNGSKSNFQVYRRNG